MRTRVHVIPSTHLKARYSGVWQYLYLQHWDGRDRQILGAEWPVSLATFMCSRFKPWCQETGRVPALTDSVFSLSFHLSHSVYRTLSPIFKKRGRFVLKQGCPKEHILTRSLLDWFKCCEWSSPTMAGSHCWKQELSSHQVHKAVCLSGPSLLPKPRRNPGKLLFFITQWKLWETGSSACTSPTMNWNPWNQESLPIFTYF